MEISKDLASKLFMQGRTITIVTPYDSCEFSIEEFYNLQDVLDIGYTDDKESDISFHVQGSMRTDDI